MPTRRTRLAVLISLIGMGLPWSASADGAGLPAAFDTGAAQNLSFPAALDEVLLARSDVIAGLPKRDRVELSLSGTPTDALVRDRRRAYRLPTVDALFQGIVAADGSLAGTLPTTPRASSWQSHDAGASVDGERDPTDRILPLPVDEPFAAPGDGPVGRPARKPHRRRHHPAPMLADVAVPARRAAGVTASSLLVPPHAGPAPGRDPRRPRIEVRRDDARAHAPRTVAKIGADDDPLVALLQVLPGDRADAAPVPYALLALRSVEGRATVRAAKVFQRLATEFVRLGEHDVTPSATPPASDVPTAAPSATDESSTVATAYPIDVATVDSVDYDVFALLEPIPGDASISVGSSEALDIFAPLARVARPPVVASTHAMAMARIEAPAAPQLRAIQAAEAVSTPAIASASLLDRVAVSPTAALPSSLLLARVDAATSVSARPRDAILARRADTTATVAAFVDRPMASLDKTRGTRQTDSVPTLVAATADRGFAVASLLERPDGIVVPPTLPRQPLLPQAIVDVGDAASLRTALLARDMPLRLPAGDTARQLQAMSPFAEILCATVDIFDPCLPLPLARTAPKADAAATVATRRAVGTAPTVAPIVGPTVAPTIAAPPAFAIVDDGMAGGRIDPLGGALVAVDESRLQQMRGGFETDNGLKISFGIERAVYINGALVTTTALNVADLGKLGVAQNAALDRATLGLIQSGPNNAFSPGQIGASSVATVIQNTLNNQRIQAITQITATVNSLDLLRRADLQSRIQSAITDSLRR